MATLVKSFIMISLASLMVLLFTTVPSTLISKKNQPNSPFLCYNKLMDNSSMQGSLVQPAANDAGSVPRENINATFDSNGELATFNAICVTDDGAYFKIFKSGTYEQYDASTNLINSGNYSMVNGIVVSISPDRVLYYDGYYLADGTTIYDCEADNSAEIPE